MAQMYNPDEIISKANTMNTQAGELKKLISEMQSIIEEMGSVWQSPAQQAFSAKFAEIEPQLSAFVKTINSFADRAKVQAEDVKKSEVV